MTPLSNPEQSDSALYYRLIEIAKRAAAHQQWELVNDLLALTRGLPR